MLVADLSSNNREPNWALLRRSGVSAVWLKATEGFTWDDPKFGVWRTAANKAGLRVGAYHFARPDTHPYVAGAKLEAEHFCRKVGKVNRTDLRPVLDYEVRGSHGGDESWARAFNRVVTDHLKVGPLFYSYSSLISDVLRFSRPVGYGLWLASYSRNDGREHPFTVPAPWKKVAAHQFSSQCRIAGCDGVVDLSKVYQPNAVLAHPMVGRV
jgi:GH25 family lysozyme M1 (1,4-beta-N-acetylmuramidase)